MSLETWAMFVAVETLLCLTPGPATLFVASQAGWRGWRAGLAAGAGIVAANSFYFVLSALGLIAVIAASHIVFLTLKWIGAAYLAWLGAKAIWGSFQRRAPRRVAGPPVANSFRDGALVQLANPKAMLFFAALLPQFIDPAQGAVAQVVILGLTSQVIEAVVLTGYALAAGGLRLLLARETVARWFERGVGTVFLSLAAVTAFYRRGS